MGTELTALMKQKQLSLSIVQLRHFTRLAAASQPAGNQSVDSYRHSTVHT